MSARTLSSVVKIKTHELPVESVISRYGLFDNDVGYYPFSKHYPGDLLVTQRPSRRHSYIEPRYLRSHSVHYPIVHESSGTRRPLSSTLWYYTEPYNYPYIHRSYSPYYSPSPDTNRILSEYRHDHIAPVASKVHQRWSVYGSPQSRAKSTPPEFFVASHVPIGDRLTRRNYHEFEVGKKLAESHSELDRFDRLLDKKFGGNNTWRNFSRYRYYPWWWSTPDYSYSYPLSYPYSYPYSYDYKLPTTDYNYTLYSPPTKVTRPPGVSVPYRSYSGYTPTSASSRIPYTSSYDPYWLRYATSYSPSLYRYEPWYTPYYSRSYYSGYPLDRSLGYSYLL